MVSTEKIENSFQEVFSGKPEVLALAPGRVNLIGEHTDYNEGFVLPMAVDRGVSLAGRKRNDPKIILYSAAHGEKAEFSLESLQSGAPRWADYFKGVALVLGKAGAPLRGCEAVVDGDLPQGAGLSSSAAFEVASAVFLRNLFRFGLGDLELVRAALRAENEFVGVSCGIMDQFASYSGEKGKALFLDCRSLEHQGVPLGKDLSVVVFNTGVKRELASSAYNDRRRECQEAVRALAAVLPGLRSLRDVSLCDFEKHQDRLPPLILRRCRHVVAENQRVLDTVEALKNGNWKRVKDLFRESHESLRDDYEVSCPELDALVELAQDHALPQGSRMTGGGFGGCTVNLVSAGKKETDEFIAFVSGGYEKRFGRKPESYVFQPSDGAKLLNGS